MFVCFLYKDDEDCSSKPCWFWVKEVNCQIPLSSLATPYGFIAPVFFWLCLQFSITALYKVTLCCKNHCAQKPLIFTWWYRLRNIALCCVLTEWWACFVSSFFLVALVICFCNLSFCRQHWMLLTQQVFILLVFFFSFSSDFSLLFSERSSVRGSGCAAMCIFRKRATTQCLG